MKHIAFEFRLAQARHPQLSESQEIWMMEAAGKLNGVGHCVRSNPLTEYPANRQIAQFFSRARRTLSDWFDGPFYEEALKRAEKKPKLLVIPGR